MVDQPRELMLLSRAKRALVEAKTVDEARDLRDTAAAIVVYAKKAKLGRNMAVEAAAVRLRAERRMGQLLQNSDLAKAAPGNQYTGPTVSPTADRASITLRELGITKADSSRSQRIASVTEEVFEEYLTSAISADREPSAAGLFRRAEMTSHHQPNAGPALQNGKRTNSGAAATAPDSPFASGYLEAASLPDVQQGQPLSVDEICELPVGAMFQLQAHLHLLCRPQELLAGLDVLEAWGFEYRDALVCPDTLKTTSDYWNSSHALLLLGVRGGLPFRTNHGTEAEPIAKERLENSRSRLMGLIEQVSPGPYAHLFGPRTLVRPGWKTWHPGD